MRDRKALLDRRNASGRGARIVRRSLAVLVFALAGSGFSAVAQQTDVERLTALLEAQQRQIDALRAELEALRAQDARTTSAQAAQPEQSGPPARTDPTAGLVLQRRDDGTRVRLMGQINQAVNLADDGSSTDLYFVDNDTAGSRIRVEATAPWGDATLGAVLEAGIIANSSNRVWQQGQRADDNFTVRHADLRIRNDAFGQLSLGRGSAAADGKTAYDLSLVSRSIMNAGGVADVAGGLRFTDGSNITRVSIANAFFAFDGVRMNRVRYDSPLFGSVQASVSAGSDQRWDLALTAGDAFGSGRGLSLGDFVVVGGLAIVDPSRDGVDYRLMGSGSIRHESTGLSLTLSAGQDKVESGRDPYNLYAKIGYDRRLFAVGDTGFGLDYTYTGHVSGQGDKGESVGLAVLQRLEPYGIDLYGQWRWYTLDRAVGPRFKDIHLLTVGARWAF